MSKSGKFLLGALLGAAAAVLLTPVTGRKARGALKKAAEEGGVPFPAIEKKAEELIAQGKEQLAAVIQKKPASSRKTNKK